MTAPATRAPIAAVVEELAARPEAEQLALLPMRQNATPAERERMRGAVERQRSGRPPGARNLATRQALDFVRRVLGDPLIERARMAMHTAESLSIELGCSKLEAAQFLDHVRADLMRLFYAPLAPVDSAGNAAVPTFNMHIGGGQAGAGADLPPWQYLELAAQKAQQLQPLGDKPDPVSHDPVSHGEAK